MDTRLLRYFVTVVEAGTVSAAAHQLHMTQPSLSRQIRQLERQLELTLFFRQHGRLHLTTEGSEFYRTARDLLQRHQEAAEYAAHLAEGRMARISLAAPNTTLTDIVAPFVATFRPQDPVPSVTEMDIDADLHLALNSYGMVVAPVRWPPQAHALHLANLPVWAYVPERHPWVKRQSVLLEELVQETLILPTVGFKARRVLDAALDQAQLSATTTLETRHSQVALALTAAGRGAAILTDDPRYGLHQLKILHQGEPLQIHLYAAWRPGHHAHATLANLAQRLKEFCLDRYPG
ncbi:LysR family transcriptional regulator [Nesterenkonia muleiensis]|uniref:LysR family transcriptional regulator n=1 Tax=Nesterenkonia muleiensis TaxID=2282648 RepID=UPI000E7344D1|nr:LysR family transcriptional regulator [Nesterenkonia muleiensis]